MKQSNIILLIAILMIASACQNADNSTTEDAAKVDLKEVLSGTWQTVQINVAVNTADGLDSFRSENISEATWTSKYRMKPPVVYFYSDQKFKKEHQNQRGEIISQSEGIWNTFGDTLMMIEADATYQYIVQHGKGRAAFRTLLDWDEDGAEDDEFQAVYRKISIGTN